MHECSDTMPLYFPYDSVCDCIRPNRRFYFAICHQNRTTNNTNHTVHNATQLFQLIRLIQHSILYHRIANVWIFDQFRKSEQSVPHLFYLDRGIWSKTNQNDNKSKPKPNQTEQKNVTKQSNLILFFLCYLLLMELCGDLAGSLVNICVENWTRKKYWCARRTRAIWL